MTVTISRPRWSRRAPRERTPATVGEQGIDNPGRVRRRQRINTTWTGPILVTLIGLAMLGWAFSHGAAAEAWLITAVALALAGIPIMLIGLRLFGYIDGD